MLWKGYSYKNTNLFLELTKCHLCTLKNFSLHLSFYVRAVTTHENCYYTKGAFFFSLLPPLFSMLDRLFFVCVSLCLFVYLPDFLFFSVCISLLLYRCFMDRLSLIVIRSSLSFIRNRRAISNLLQKENCVYIFINIAYF